MENTLLKYWGYSSFRPLQKEIISSVLDGNDTIALLPTGGGKSLCYQLPTMMDEGLCIVVTPLVALMQDQVHQLRKKGIRAIAVHSGMGPKSIDIAIDNCIYGDYKFLYIAPERIGSPIFMERFEKMNIRLIAVDEAHCISQWGYDFRPAYFGIPALREKKPNVPILALTASATQKVVEDIALRLELKDPATFRKSFAKENLQYVVEACENKKPRLLHILKKIGSSAVVYCRNRKKTKEISDFLRANKVSSDYYHAGLTAEVRAKKQNAWIKDQVPVMVCTNAFGMGIDKPNVRVVVHMDLPDSLEAYYQEAGRAGRDGKRAFAVTLFDKEDVLQLEGITEKQFPEISFVQRVYQALANYYQIGIGNKTAIGLDFELFKFAAKYDLPSSETFFALKLLELEGWIQVNEAVYQSSRLQFIMNTNELYGFEIANKAFVDVINVLLRSYEGVFESSIKVNEQLIANRLDSKKDLVIKQLTELDKRGVVKYFPTRDKPTLWFMNRRVDAKNLKYSSYFNQRKQTVIENKDLIINFISNDSVCRERILLEYFDERVEDDCGRCDVCLSKEKKDVKQMVLSLFDSEREIELRDLFSKLNMFQEKELLETIRLMIDDGILDRVEDKICLNE